MMLDLIWSEYTGSPSRSRRRHLRRFGPRSAKLVALPADLIPGFEAAKDRAISRAPESRRQ